MIKKMKLISFKRLLKSMIVLIILGAIISFEFSGDAITLLKGPKDLMTLTDDEMNNAYVSVDINSVFDSFSFDNSIRDSAANLFGISTGENQVFLAIRANSVLQAKLRPIQQQTSDLLKEGRFDNTSKLSLIGVLANMTDKEKESFYESLSQYNIDLEHNKIISYVLLPGDNPFGNDKVGVYLWGGVGAALLGLVAIRLIYGILGGYQRKVTDKLRGMNEIQKAEIEKDYKESKGFSGDIRIGSTYIFCYKGARTEVFTAEEMKGIFIQNAKIQRKKGVTKLDLIIKLVNGSQYRIVGEETGNIISYLKEHFPVLTNLITYEHSMDEE